MERRDYLKYSGIGLLVSSSGCLGILDNNSKKTGDRDTTNPFNSQRVIEPSHSISYPINNKDSWRPNYLGENMSRQSDVDYSRLNNATVYDTSIESENNSNAFSVRTFNSSNDNVFEPNEPINYSNEFVAIIETGQTYISDRHNWVRVEEVEDGYVLYGYYRKPYTPNPDNNLVSVVSIENTKNINEPKLYVSIVINEDHQVIINSDEDVVNLELLS